MIQARDAMISNKDTICAIATPPGCGGLGVVRISGPAARDILAELWRGKVKVADFKIRQLYLGELVDQPNEVVDQIMAVFMPGPQTYTGDNVVELSCHGAPVILQRVLKLCIAAGARLAQPGEFTRRAFLKGKLDLAQAEAVAALIHSSSEQAARQAQEQLAGRLSQEVSHLHDELTNLRAFVEATIDFPEEDIEMIEHEGIAKKLQPIKQRIEHLSQSYQRGRAIVDGIRVAIVGQPNVGKSSLLNRLSGTERAIVHDAPGTTRDTIELSINLDGFIYHLIDTAGIREGVDHVEQIGVGRSEQAIAQADLVMLVLDASKNLEQKDKQILAKLKNKNYIKCINKIDLGINSEWREDEGAILLSAKTGEGIDTLFAKLKAASSPIFANESSSAVVTNLRHKESLDQSAKALQQASACIAKRESAEFCAHHLQASQTALCNIIGRDVSEEVLAKIFGEFCIGK